MVSSFITVLRGEPDIGILEQKRNQRMSVTGVSIGASSFKGRLPQKRLSTKKAVRPLKDVLPLNRVAMGSGVFSWNC
jgi:helix-turn-helix protein